jgi:glutathione peroxidase
LVVLDKNLGPSGLQVLAFPCNQFKGQESRSEPEIKKFVKDNYGVTFPLFSKIDVNGPNTNPLYIYLRTHSTLHDTKTGLTK